MDAKKGVLSCGECAARLGRRLQGAARRADERGRAMAEQTYGETPRPRRTSRLAVASFVCGLCFFVPLVGPLLAVGLGVAALVEIARARGELKGSGLAIAGIVMGALFFLATCLVAPFGAALLLPRLKQDAADSRAKSNLERIGMAVLMYEGDYDAMPPDMEILYAGRYVRDLSIFDAPGETERTLAGSIDETSGYRYFPVRRGADTERPYPDDAPIAWEKRPRRHDGMVRVLTADGAVVRMPRTALAADVERYRELYLTTPMMPE